MEWLPPYPSDNSCLKIVALIYSMGRMADMTTETMIGIDLAKSVFQLHGASMTGQVKFRKKLSTLQFRKLMAEHPVATLVMEACGSAHYWAREMAKHGHEVKLIAPQYVRPFVKRQKNDAADAEAIVIAAQRPEMRFIIPKMEESKRRHFFSVEENGLSANAQNWSTRYGRSFMSLATQPRPGSGI